MPDPDTASDSVAATPDLKTRVSNMIEKCQNYEADFAISGEEMEEWLCGRVAPLFKELRGEMEGMRKNRDNLRVYLADRTEQRDQAQHDRAVMNTQVYTARRILRAVTDAAIRPPAALDPTIRIAPGKRTGQQAAEVALWQHQCTANAIQFVAELASMTDNECDFLDGHEMRAIARLLQVPDDEGNRAPTVPRLYSEQDRQRAADAISVIAITRTGDTLGERCLIYVDAVAEALGMRRAGA